MESGIQKFKKTVIKDSRSFLFHITFILLCVILVFFRTLPLLLDSRLDYGGDEVFHAREIWEYLNGRDLFFYYENVNYHGIFEGLAAIPFVKLFGFYPLPYKLPVIAFYGLFIWSTYLILQTFNRKAAWIACVLLLFPPRWVLTWSLLNNYVFSPTMFLGNLALFYLIKVKTNPSLNIKFVFLLCFFSGLAIYIWTYSIIYIFTIFFLLALTHLSWDEFRDRISFKKFFQNFGLLKTKKEKLSKIYDLILYLFIFSIVYSYIFGGFGLDVGGVTILQINNLHKPIFQIVPLIIFRLILDKMSILSPINNPFRSFWPIQQKESQLVLFGFGGFILGIFPRIVSILNGSVTRGGQGFDMDFSPLRIFVHVWELLKMFPSIMEIDFRSRHFSSQNNDQIYLLGHKILVFPLAIIAACSFYFFIRSNWGAIKNLIILKRLPFSPVLVFLILPASLCASVIVTMNGPEQHYLIPIYWTITIYTALFIVEMLKKSKILAVSFLLIWIMFYFIKFEYSLNEFFIYKNEITSNNPDGLKKLLSRSQEPYLNLIKFLKSNGINAVYASYSLSSNLIINSDGSIAAAEYNVSGRSKRLRENLNKHLDFALVFHKTDNKKTKVLRFLRDNNLAFKKQKIDSFVVFWGFSGAEETKNKLRYLIS